MRRLPIAAAAAALVLSTASTAAAVDVVVPNFGFESGLASWVQFGAGGNTTTTERAYAGTTSAKVVDGSGTDATGLESSRRPAAPGAYVVHARVFVVSGAPDLYLRYWNSAGELLSSNYSSVTGPVNQWTLVRTHASAPAGTALVSVIVYSSKGNTGTAYWDQVVLTRTGPTDLGVQVNNSAPIGTTFGTGADEHHAYGVITAPHTESGMAARLGEIDVNTETAVDRGPLPGALGASSATTATDGSIYIGSNTKGHLYRYWPSDHRIADVGVAIAGEHHIWSLDAGPAGRVYGGTSQQSGLAGGGYFTYRPGDGFANLGNPIWPDGQHYVRSLAFDPRAGQEATYLGLGYSPRAALVRYDRATQAKVNILPARFADRKGVNGLIFTGDRLFAQVDSEMVVLRVTKSASGALSVVEEAAFAANNREVSPAEDGKVYFTRSGRLHSYDIASKAVTALDPVFRTKITEFGWVTLADQTQFPGRTLVAIGQINGTAWLFKYNPATNHAREAAVRSGMPLLPNRLTTITTAPDGRILAGGHLVGGLGFYRPMLGHGDDSLPGSDLFRGIGQIEGMLTHDDTVYFGVYPGAVMYRMRPGGTPESLPGMPSIGNKQDRPFAMTAGGGKLFVGTVATYGWSGGGLTEYDIATGAHTVHRDIIPDQSITALAYHNGIVYGGSSTRIPLGSGTSPATEARLFTYNPANDTTVQHRLPVQLKSITALFPVSGRIWGVADNSLFVFDPATSRFSTPPVVKFANAQIPAWKNATLVTTPLDANHVYGTAGHDLIKINKSTLAVTVLHTVTGMENLTVDEYGSLYYTVNDRLYRWGI